MVCSGVCSNSGFSFVCFSRVLLMSLVLFVAGWTD